MPRSLLIYGSIRHLLPDYRLFYYLCISTIRVIAINKLHTDQFREYFKDKKFLGTNDIFQFYSDLDSTIKITTVNWRVYSLVRSGILNRIGRGKFVLGEGQTYIPEISSKIKTLNTRLKKEFPYLNFCLWNTSSFNEFMVHQPGRFYILLEVEKEATQSVFFFLKENKLSVFIDPTKDLIEKYIPDEKETLMVKALVSEAPIQLINGVNLPTLEKMLVDIFCDDVIFAAQQGSEMRTIFREAMKKYTINENRMLRYADRRRKKESFKQYLNSISNLLQQS
ncbi:MAG: DUF6577 family protein [Bacteroidales bacterium]